MEKDQEKINQKRIPYKARVSKYYVLNLTIELIEI
jgi:hypothetical protein